MVLLYKNNGVLYTHRTQNLPPSTFFSNLAGSIIGLLGMIGVFMNIIEEKYDHYLKFRVHRRSLKELENTRNELIEKNLFTFSVPNAFNASAQATSRELLSSVEISSTVDNFPNYNSFFSANRIEDPTRYKVEGLK